MRACIGLEDAQVAIEHYDAIDATAARPAETWDPVATRLFPERRPAAIQTSRQGSRG